MIFSVVKRCFEVDERIACQNAVFDCFAQTFFDCGDKLTRNCAADDCVDKLELTVFRARFVLDEYVAVLTCAARLLFVLTFRLRSLADSFAICDSGFLPRDVDAEFGFYTLAHNVELSLTETADKHVAGFNVLFDLERCVFFLHFDKTLNCFFFVFKSLDRVRDNGLGEFYFFKLNL